MTFVNVCITFHAILADILLIFTQIPNLGAVIAETLKMLEK